MMDDDTAARSTADPAVGGDGKDPVLVVDLDGTLSRTDTLHEALVGVVSRKPAQIPGIIAALMRGKVAFKRRVADIHVMPGQGLPYDGTVIEVLQGAREEGRRTALVSASEQRQVDEVAAHLELFDDAFGTGPASAGRNLGGRSKAEFLVQHYGRKGFDYVGDSQTDLPVWSAARIAVTVGAGAALQKKAASANANVLHLAPVNGMARARAMMKALRPHQWSKNLLIFLPMLAAHDVTSLPAALAAFVAFCLTASSVYLVNDLVDLQADRAHPRKRARPFASGDLPISLGVIMAPALVALAILMALFFTPVAFLACLLVYYVVTFAYSFWLKRKALLDVLTLAGLYTARIVAGAAACGVGLSPWMLGFSMFLFLALAAVKRQAELAQQAPGTRPAARGYEAGDLPLLREIALASGFAAVVVFALYISSEDVLRLYSMPEMLWLICPLLLYWIGRMVLMTHRGWMADDPIVFAARDWPSWLVVLLSLGIVIGAGVWP